MSSIVNFLIGLVLTTATGSIVLLVWLLVKYFCEKWGYIRLMYRTLWLAAFSFAVPVMSSYYLLVGQEGIECEGLLQYFDYSPTIYAVCGKLFPVWLCGAAVILLFHIAGELYCLRYRYRAIRCQGRKQEIFAECVRELGLSGQGVGLYESYYVRTPVITGLWNAKVMLPIKEYDEEELRVIVLHELTHYLQKDLWLKKLVNVVTVFHWFNPLAWLLRMLVQRWGEYACDAYVCTRTGKVKQYFEIIMLQAVPDYWRHAGQSMLIADRHEVLRRVEKMKLSLNKTNVKKGWVAVLAAVMLFGGGVSVYAASEAITTGYSLWYRATDVDIEEEPQPQPELTEIEETGDNGMTVEIGETTNFYGSNSSGSFSWTVGTNVRKTSGEFSASSGETITVVASIAPADVSVKVGIIEPDGTRRSVTGKDVVTHAFKLDQTGSYKVFVENTNTTSVTANGGYSVK